MAKKWLEVDFPLEKETKGRYNGNVKGRGRFPPAGIRRAGGQPGSFGLFCPLERQAQSSLHPPENGVYDYGKQGFG
ncbi:MAG TPA: hypothetical protein H9680_04250 [Firmicutes bacterium]|nr:hypothetical protein [Bacillota bacterium]